MACLNDNTCEQVDEFTNSLPELRFAVTDLLINVYHIQHNGDCKYFGGP
jgi:hypothetical protein